MPTQLSCSWCHEMSDSNLISCPACGHDLNAPRMACRCPACQVTRDQLTQDRATLQPKQRVTVFQDPVTRTELEGQARLIKFLDHADPELGERWIVQFENDDLSGPVTRWVWPNRST